MTEFKFIDRGFGETLVLVPGWAADYRIFAALELNYNYLFAAMPRVEDFSEKLVGVLDELALDKVSLFGWSLGGFLIADFAVKNPDKVIELNLISAREKFDGVVLEEIKKLLKQNKKAYLYSFYAECFCEGDKDAFSWFKKHLLKVYIAEMELQYLLDGLDYLKIARFDITGLAQMKNLKIFHGEADKIVPFEEGVKFKKKLPEAQFFALPKIGHIPFLNKDFNPKFHG